MSCSHWRPGRFTQDSGRWRKIHRATGMSDMPLFWGGVIHAHHKPSVALGEVPTPLYTKCTQSRQDAKILYNKAWFCTCRPVLKGMWILLNIVAQTSGWGNLTDFIFPTIHPFRVPQCIFYVRVSSTRVPWWGGQSPAPKCCNSM